MTVELAVSIFYVLPVLIIWFLVLLALPSRRVAKFLDISKVYEYLGVSIMALIPLWNILLIINLFVETGILTYEIHKK